MLWWTTHLFSLVYDLHEHHAFSYASHGHTFGMLLIWYHLCIYALHLVDMLFALAFIHLIDIML